MNHAADAVIFMQFYGGGGLENILQIVPLIEKLLNYGVATLCTVALLAGLAWHFWKLKPTLDAQNQLIHNNTLATQALSDCSRSTTAILDKVSDKLIAHDERALNLQQNVAVFVEGINTLKSTVATRDSISRLHERLDNGADKKDIELIHKRLDKVDEDVRGMDNLVSKIAGKVGC